MSTQEFLENRFIGAESLSPEECDKLIKNIFKNESKTEYPTYYQINLFINILAGQLKKFSLNFLLTAAKLIESGFFINNNELKYIREPKVLMINCLKQNMIMY